MNRNPRLTGLLFLILGVPLTWWFVWTPWTQAHQHLAEISLSFKGMLMSILCLLYGPAMMLVPGTGQKGARSPLQVLLAIVSVGGALAFYLWYRSQLEGLGYHFTGF